jgi:RHS repeat-associated protein
VVLEESWFDPLVEFLEIVTEVRELGNPSATRRSWRVHGPDANGSYGGLQGLGGLEAVYSHGADAVASGSWSAVIDDYYGHVIATVEGTVEAQSVVWQRTRNLGYGPAPDSPVWTLSEGATLEQATAWRGRRQDITGFYWMGARYYESSSGRFLSPDPYGHAASLSLYDYAGGDPINFVDPTGRSPSPQMDVVQKATNLASRTFGELMAMGKGLVSYANDASGWVFSVGSGGYFYPEHAKRFMDSTVEGAFGAVQSGIRAGEKAGLAVSHLADGKLVEAVEDILSIAGDTPEQALANGIAIAASGGIMKLVKKPPVSRSHYDTQTTHPPALPAANNGARFGTASSTNYRGAFFEANPGLEGQVVVHHAVERQALTRFSGTVTEAQIHSLENLRGIPKAINSDVHLSQIRKSWNEFYRNNPSPTQQQLLDHATIIDDQFGHLFTPPLR